MDAHNVFAVDIFVSMLLLRQIITKILNCTQFINYNFVTTKVVFNIQQKRDNQN